MMGLRPGYRGYFIEVRWVTNHWVYIVHDIQGNEVDRFLSLDDVTAAIDDWTEGSVR